MASALLPLSVAESISWFLSTKAEPLFLSSLITVADDLYCLSLPEPLLTNSADVLGGGWLLSWTLSPGLDSTLGCVSLVAVELAVLFSGTSFEISAAGCYCLSLLIDLSVDAYFLDWHAPITT